MNIFKKAYNFVAGRKSAEPMRVGSDYYWSNYFHYKSYVKVSNLQAIIYYLTVSPVNHSINLITDELQSIEPLIYDNVKKEFTDSVGQEVLSLLNKPNKDSTYSEFIQGMGIFFNATGDSYIVATGDIKRAPLELFIIQSQDVVPEYTSGSPYVDRYMVDTAQGQIIFERIELNGNVIYVDSTKGRQLWHIKDFNPYNRYEGLSSLNPLYYDVEQYIESSVHNLSLLKRGAKISGLLTVKQPLSDSQKEELRKQLSNMYSGSENTGRAMVLDADADFKSMMLTSQDMDYGNMRKGIIRAIYNCQKVPLALVHTEEMAQATYEKALLALYDNAVIPLINRDYMELTNFLFPRFGLDINRYSIWYNAGDIPALAIRRNEEILRKQKSGVYLINELRALYGLKPIEGGDVLYQPLNLVPVGTTMQPGDEKSMKDRYVDIMKKYKNPDGTRKYSDEYIAEMVKMYFNKK